MAFDPAARAGAGETVAPLGTPISTEVTPLYSGRYSMNSRGVAGMPVMRASVLSGNLVGRPTPSQRHLPASVLAYRSRPLAEMGVMFAPERALLIRVQRAWIAVVAA